MTDDEFPHEVSKQLDETLRKLVDQTIAQVWYLETPDFEVYRGGAHLNVDEVCLEFVDGSRWWLSTGEDFSAYNLTFGVDSEKEKFIHPASKFCEEMTTFAPWSEVLSQTVSDVQLYWGWTRVLRPAGPPLPESASTEESLAWMLGPQEWSPAIYFPQDVVLTFDSGRRIFLCSGWLNSAAEFVHGENMVNVVYDEAVAEVFGAGPYLADARTSSR